MSPTLPAVQEPMNPDAVLTERIKMVQPCVWLRQRWEAYSDACEVAHNAQQESCEFYDFKNAREART